MAYKLSVIDQNKTLSFNVKYENMARATKPEIEAKSPDGKAVKERTVYQGTVLQKGDTTKQWCDEDGKVFAKSELTFWLNGEQVAEKEMTKVFEIVGYQPETAYTDQYVISAYYEMMPHDNDMKKDFDRDRARVGNLSGMRKLWEHLKSNKVVARGEFNVSSRGFVASDGYIRAIEFGNKWGLEIGVFSQEKIFEHLQEGIPQMPQAQVTAIKKLKMV